MRRVEIFLVTNLLKSDPCVVNGLKKPPSHCLVTMADRAAEDIRKKAPAIIRGAHGAAVAIQAGAG